MFLTIALFIFTFAGVVTIARDIWPENSKKTKKDEELHRLIEQYLKQQLQNQHNKKSSQQSRQ